jgi:hypothetical protein
LTLAELNVCVLVLPFPVVTLYYHNMTTQTINDAQRAFDEKYITAGQIMRDLKISRAALLYARRCGKLPEPIVVNEGRLFVWSREIVQAQLDAWKLELKARRGH